MVDFVAIRKAQRANGPATVMAIGTATPPNCVEQSNYADFYFRITNSGHMTELKQKLQHMCERSTIKTRYTYITEDLLKENPNLGVYNAPSWNTRRDILVEEIPKLAEKAATKAIKEWGQPKSKITHLIFCNTGSVDMPGPDLQLSKLLNLNPSVKRYMMYQQGCFGGGAALRLAKDLAENNQGARVLIVSSEITISAFTGPSGASLDNILGQALFGDGAAAVIVGADPIIGVEKPLFQIVSALQTIIPDSEDALNGHIREEGLVFHVRKDVAGLVSDNLETCLKDAFEPLGVSNWNSLFWLVHPGGPAILDKIEEKLNLKHEKLCASRTVLSEYGNTESAAILFVLDEMRKKSTKEGFKTTGEGLDFGVLIALGPGITIETVVLHSMPT